jgi:hypothetical protein
MERLLWATVRNCSELKDIPHMKRHQQGVRVSTTPYGVRSRPEELLSACTVCTAKVEKSDLVIGLSFLGVIAEPAHDV